MMVEGVEAFERAERRPPDAAASSDANASATIPLYPTMTRRTSNGSTGRGNTRAPACAMKREFEGEHAVEGEFESVQRAVPRSARGIGRAVKRERRAVGEDDENHDELEILGFHHGTREAVREATKRRKNAENDGTRAPARTTETRRRRASRRTGRDAADRRGWWRMFRFVFVAFGFVFVRFVS